MSNTSAVHRYFHSMIEIGAIKVFIEHHIFKAIPNEGSISISEVAEKIGGEYNLIARFSNYLIGAGILLSPTKGHVAHSTTSKESLDPNAAGLLLFLHAFDFFLVSSVRWSEFFTLYGLAEPKKANQTPFGLASGHPDKDLYQVLETMPKRAEQFNRTMALTMEQMPITGIYYFSWVGKYTEVGSNRPLIVDIGGGKGQVLRAILQENQTIEPTRCVLQDQEAVIKESIQETAEGDMMSQVNKVSGSFFEKQKTKGALVYFIRRVLNDWPDEDCLTILRHTREACVRDSRLIISEQLLPPDPSLELAALDIWMMNFGGKRRNERMFRELASKASFGIDSISLDNASG